MCATEKSIFCNSLNHRNFVIKAVMVWNYYLMQVWANFFIRPLFFKTPFDWNGRYKNFAPLCSSMLVSECNYGLVASREVFLCVLGVSLWFWWHMTFILFCFRLSCGLLYVLYLRVGCRSSWNESINRSLNSSMAYKYCSLLPQTYWAHSFVLFLWCKEGRAHSHLFKYFQLHVKKPLSITDGSVVV